MQSRVAGADSAQAVLQTAKPITVADVGVHPPIQKIATAPTADDFQAMGLSKYKKQDYQGALADYNQALRLNPNLATAYYNRGIVRRHLGDKQGALADFQQAAALARQQRNEKLYETVQEAIKELQQ